MFQVYEESSIYIYIYIGTEVLHTAWCQKLIFLFNKITLEMSIIKIRILVLRNNLEALSSQQSTSSFIIKVENHSYKLCLIPVQPTYFILIIKSIHLIPKFFHLYLYFLPLRIFFIISSLLFYSLSLSHGQINWKYML